MPHSSAKLAASKPIQFELKKILATGSQGSVYLAKRKDKGIPKEVAVKRVQLSMDEESQEKETKLLNSKIIMLLDLNHPNVVCHITAQFCPPKKLTDPATYDLIMEYCAGGTLHDAVKKAISLRLLQKWIKDILSGIYYIHERRIVHRDIKGDNIFLSHADFDQAVLKIGDLGFFKLLLNSITRRGEVSHTKGTTPFMSPEMIQAYSHNKNIGRKTDIWSLGCVIIQMITGQMPQFTKVLENGQRITLQGTSPVMNFVGNGGIPDIPADLPPALEEFLRACLRSDPEIRPRAAELLHYPFLNLNTDSLNLPVRSPIKNQISLIACNN